MIIDRKAFFDALRKSLFTNGFKQSQVDGLQFILNVWEQHYQDQTPITQFANCLGQTYLESAATMQPIHEYGDTAYFKRMYDIEGSRPSKARELGNLYPGDGAKFAGMGYIQSTGRANARRNTRKLRERGIIGPDVDFEVNPKLMMKPEYAIHIMFLGMEEGFFTGRKLDDFIDDKIDGDEHADYIKARAIINGSDRAADVANYSSAFLAALKAAQRAGSPAPIPAPVARPVEAPTPPVPPAAPVPPKPPEPPATTEVKPPTVDDPAPVGWFEHLLGLLRSHRKST